MHRRHKTNRHGTTMHTDATSTSYPEIACGALITCCRRPLKASRPSWRLGTRAPTRSPGPQARTLMSYRAPKETSKGLYPCNNSNPTMTRHRSAKKKRQTVKRRSSRYHYVRWRRSLRRGRSATRPMRAMRQPTTGPDARPIRRCAEKPSERARQNLASRPSYPTRVRLRRRRANDQGLGPRRKGTHRPVP